MMPPDLQADRSALDEALVDLRALAHTERGVPEAIAARLGVAPDVTPPGKQSR